MVTPTTFNKKDFNRSITCTEADILRKEIKFDPIVHWTIFNSNREGKLFVTFKLVLNLYLDEIQQSFKNYFCINKNSDAGHHDKINGVVIHPNLEGPKSDQENFNKGEQVAEKETTEIKIEVCKYQLTEDEIKQGLAPFGEQLTPHHLLKTAITTLQMHW